MTHNVLMKKHLTCTPNTIALQMTPKNKRLLPRICSKHRPWEEKSCKKKARDTEPGTEKKWTPSSPSKRGKKASVTVRLPRYYSTRQKCKKWNLYLKVALQTNNRNPPTNPGTDEVTGVCCGAGHLWQGQVIVIMIVVPRIGGVTMAPAPPTRRRSDHPRVDSQQKTGNLGQSNQQREGGQAPLRLEYWHRSCLNAKKMQRR